MRRRQPLLTLMPRKHRIPCAAHEAAPPPAAICRRLRQAGLRQAGHARPALERDPHLSPPVVLNLRGRRDDVELDDRVAAERVRPLG